MSGILILGVVLAIIGLAFVALAIRISQTEHNPRHPRVFQFTGIAVGIGLLDVILMITLL